MKALVFVMLACASACSWFGSRKHVLPDPSEIVVTGAPVGSLVFVDGTQAGEATLSNDHPQAIDVPPGEHKVEIHVGDSIVYRENTYVAVGEHRVVTVLSGLTR